MAPQDAIPDGGRLGELCLARLNALMWNGCMCRRHKMAKAWIWRPQAPRGKVRPDQLRIVMQRRRNHHWVLGR